MRTSFFWIFLLLGFIARCLYAFNAPYTLDEYHGHTILQFSPWTEIFYFISIFDTQLPLFYLLSWPLATRLSLEDIFLLRLPSLFFYAVSFFVVRKIAHRYLKTVGALTFFFLVSFSPLLFTQTLYFRPYALLWFFSLLSFFYFIALYVDGKRDKGTWAGFTITLLFLVQLHYFGVLLVFLYLSFLLLSPGKRLPLWPWGCSLIVFLLMALSPHLYYMARNFNMHHVWRRDPQLGDLLGLIGELMGGKGLTALFFSVGFYLLLKKRRFLLQTLGSPLGLVCLGLSSSAVLITFFKSVFSAPAMDVRFLIIITPPLYLLMAKTFDLILEKELP